MIWEQKEKIFSVIQKHAFLKGVGIFGLNFLSHLLTKMRSFCAYQKGNFLNFSKLILLFSLVHLKRLKRAFTQNLHFFGGHPVVALKMLRSTVEAYIIKWIISGEPLVDLKSQ